MNENESTADVAEKVQKKLRPMIVHEKNKFPILEKATVHHKDNENIAPHGVAPKGKRVIHVKET